MSTWQHRDHAEVGNTVWWPDERRQWRVTGIGVTGGRRCLHIARDDPWDGRVTRVVWETAVTSNAFEVPAPGRKGEGGDNG